MTVVGRTRSAATGVRILLWAALTLSVLVLPAGARPPLVGGGRPFADASPFNVAIADNAPTDPAGRAMVARATRSGAVSANLYAYGVPIYHAQPDDPRHEVRCTHEGEWGACPLSAGPRRIPAGARPSRGSDGAMVVVQDDGSIDEYWQARRDGSTWTASWGAVNAWDGSGWGGASTGSGASRLAGVVRVAEVRSGRVEHALALQSGDVCARTVRPPALKTDGTSERADCIPEGARLQLDPTIDLAALTDLTPGERTVARALQVYGGYVMDRSGAPLSVSFEVARDATGSFPGSVYARAGLGWDYEGMTAIPWGRLRVLAP